MRSLGLAWVVMVKELRDAMRDKRSVLSALLAPLLGPLLMAFSFNSAVEQAGLNKSIEMAVVNLSEEASLYRFLDSMGVEFVEAPEDPEQAVLDGEIELALIFPPNAEELYRQAKSVPTELISDSSKPSSKSHARRAERFLKAWNQEQGTLRLVARGIQPEIIQPLKIHEVDLATPEEKAASFLEMMTMFLVLAAFFSSMYVAIDSTAGERERKSLEPLKVQPVSPTMLILGKAGAATALALLGMSLALVCSAAAMQQLPAADLGIRVSPDPTILFSILLLALPTAPLAACLLMLFSCFAKSFKEAQTYSSFAIFIPMVPGFYLTLNPGEPQSWMHFCPILAQQIQIGQIFRGELVQATEFMAGVASTLGLAGIFMALTVTLFSRESMLFGD